MTTKVLCVCLILVAALAVAATNVDVATTLQKPVVTKNTTPDYRSGLVATVEELWKKSDAVVEVVVGRTVKSAARGTLIFSLVELTIGEVFKVPEGVTRGSVINLRRRGGTVDMGDRIETQEVQNYPQFTPGRRFIMFLRRSEGDSPDFGVYVYETTYGPDSVFAVDGPTGPTPSRGNSALAQRLSQSGPQGLRAAIARLRGGR